MGVPAVCRAQDTKLDRKIAIMCRPTERLNTSSRYATNCGPLRRHSLCQCHSRPTLLEIQRFRGLIEQSIEVPVMLVLAFHFDPHGGMGRSPNSTFQPSELPR